MIGLRIRQLRKERKISCRQLGKDIGLSASALSHYETGISTPSVESTLRIAEYFHVSTDYLLGRSEYRTPGRCYGRSKEKRGKKIHKCLD